MSEITLKLYASGFDTVTVDCDEYEAAKVAGDLDQMLDVYVSDIETDTTIEEPDGTIVTLPEGNVLPPSGKLPPAWPDLLEALELLATHQNNDISPFHCEHDTLTVCADPAAFTPEEIARLDKLGFIVQSEYDSFTSFRFGSA